MTEQEVKDYLVEMGHEDTIVYTNPSYSEAFVGVTSDGIAIYDYEGMVECLIQDGMSEEDAVEWIDYNCVGCRGEGLPMIINIGNDRYAAQKEALPVKTDKVA